MKTDSRVFFADYIQRCVIERGPMTYPSLVDAIKAWDETMEKFETKQLDENQNYEYEMFIDDKNTAFEMNSWIPISTDRIKDISRIEEYIQKGLIRKINK